MFKKPTFCSWICHCNYWLKNQGAPFQDRVCSYIGVRCVGWEEVVKLEDGRQSRHWAFCLGQRNPLLAPSIRQSAKFFLRLHFLICKMGERRGLPTCYKDEMKTTRGKGIPQCLASTGKRAIAPQRYHCYFWPKFLYWYPHVFVRLGCYDKYCSLGGFNNNLCLIALEAGRSMIKVPGALIPGESLLPGS